MTLPTPTRTLIACMWMRVDADQAEAVRKNVSGCLTPWVEWHDWRYDPGRLLLRGEGKATFEDPDHPGGELAELANLSWDATEEYCDVYMLVNPCERDQRLYVQEEEHYAEYLDILRELGIDPDVPDDSDEAAAGAESAPAGRQGRYHPDS